jgi:hypothetical protein
MKRRSIVGPIANWIDETYSGLDEDFAKPFLTAR